MNPVNEALLARAQNKLNPYSKHTTTDKDIIKRVWLPIDIDPIRPAGVSATDQEHQMALEMASNIYKFLKSKGWPSPLVGDSGNGCHLLYKIDLPNDKDSRELIKNCLKALDIQFSNEKVAVDTTTYNAARIWKLYGTIACKGDDTEDRPYRWARIIKCPDELMEVKKEQIETLAGLIPVPDTKKSKSTRKNQVDVPVWIEKHGIEVSYTKEIDNGIIYILSRCPWNDVHTDRSAYICKFNNGSIVARCHHESCKDESWETLRDKYEPDWKKEAVTESEDKKETQAEILLRSTDKASLFMNETEEPYVVFEVDDHKEIHKLGSQKTEMWLRKQYLEQTGKPLRSDALNQVRDTLQTKAYFENNTKKLYKRVAKHEDAFYYDLADRSWSTVKITKEGCIIDNSPPILFERNKNMKSQVLPDFEANPSEILDAINKHYNIKNHDDMILYATYLITCFVPDISHPILVLYGEKGAAKSTTMTMTRIIVDPAVQMLLSMPSSGPNLALTLANNYMPCFDNLDTLSSDKSDMLCTACTGGGFSKRKLYTDDEEVILQFKRCVVLNGINLVATKPDLIDRAILVELDRIKPTVRKTDEDIWQAFYKDLPKIKGAIFKVLSKAMSIYQTIELEKVGRLADFTRWGYAVAEAMEIGGERFLEVYLENQNRGNEEAIDSHPVATAIVALMRDNGTWSGSVSELLKKLEFIAEKELINTRVKAWPKSANVLSKRLKEVKSNLEDVGLYYDIRHAGSHKKVTIEKR